MSGVAALAKLEARRCWSVALMPLAALAIAALAWSLQGTWRFAHAWLPDLLCVVLIPLVAAGLGADALASEREARTWPLLRARPISLRGLIAVKAGIRLLVLAIVMAGSALVVHAFRGRHVGWLERLDVSGAQGAALSLMLSLAAFGLAFAASAKLDEPLSAMIAGGTAALVLVGALLAPGWQAGGSLRTALASPREWRDVRSLAAEDGPLRADFMSPSQRLGVARLPDRVVLLALDEGGPERPRRIVLPRGTRTDGTFVGEQVVVSFVAGCGRVDRLVGASGTSRPIEPAP